MSKLQVEIKRDLLIKIVGVLLPIFLLLFVEGGLRIFNYGGNINLFINAPSEQYDDYKMVNPEVGKKYFLKNQYTRPGNDFFLKEKPENGFRVFVLGSSTAVGFPYNINVSFPRILQYRLQDAYPNKNIEVINTAITAINSFTLLDYTNQIIKEDPDVVLIYAGHNEFYGAYGIGSNENTGKNRGLTLAHLKLMNLKIYRLVQNTIHGIGKVSSRSRSNSSSRNLMEKIVKDPEIRHSSAERQITFRNYETNMTAIVQKLQKKGVPIIISDVVCNIKDLKPFVSAVNSGEQPAFEVYNKAQKALETRDYKHAKNLFEQARDLDALPFRAPSKINAIIHQISEQYKIPLVEMRKYFESNSPNMLVGDNLMTEHVHPNKIGYFLMAEAFYKKVVQLKLAEEAPNLYSIVPLTCFINNWGYTSIDQYIANYKINKLKRSWPFVSKTEQLDMKAYAPPINSDIDSLAFEVLKKNINLGSATEMVARALENNADYYNACRYYKTLSIMNPHVGMHHLNIARCLLKNNDLAQAQKYFQKSIAYNQTYSAYYSLGNILFIKHNFTNALKTYAKALKLTEKQPEKLEVLKKIYLSHIYQGDESKANATLVIIRNIDPFFNPQIPSKEFTFQNYVPGEIKDGIAKSQKLIAEGNLDDALTLLKATSNINDAPIANFMTGAIHFTKKDFGSSAFYYSKVQPYFQNDPNYLNQLIYLNYISRNIEEAKNQLNILKKINPQYPTIGEIEKMLGAN